MINFLNIITLLICNFTLGVGKMPDIDPPFRKEIAEGAKLANQYRIAIKRVKEASNLQAVENAIVLRNDYLIIPFEYKDSGIGNARIAFNIMQVFQRGAKIYFNHPAGDGDYSMFSDEKNMILIEFDPNDERLNIGINEGFLCTHTDKYMLNISRKNNEIESDENTLIPLVHQPDLLSASLHGIVHTV